MNNINMNELNTVIQTLIAMAGIALLIIILGYLMGRREFRDLFKRDL